MRIKRLVAAAALALSVTSATAASADPADLTAIRDGVRGLEARSKEVRTRCDRTGNSLLQRNIDRILRVIDNKRASLSTRIAVIELLGPESVEPKVIEELASYFEATSNLLARIESWFYIR